MKIKTESELEELLSRPDQETASAMAVLDGDLLILGAGGKMGPSLARLARRAIDQAGVKKRVIAVARFTNGDCPPQSLRRGSKPSPATCSTAVRSTNFPIFPTSSSWPRENSARLARNI